MTTGLVEDRYLLGDVVGRGDMSVVHRARDLRLSRDVAVKVLRTDLAGDPLLQKRFRRAARSAGNLNDPAIVAVYDAGEMPLGTGHVPFIVLEYVDGSSLRDLIARNGPLPPARAMTIAADLCAALACCHHHGIVHGNITSSTVMIDRSGAVKVMDFGATSTEQEATRSTTSSRNGQSPEQIYGLPVDARADVLGTGRVLQEMIELQPGSLEDVDLIVAMATEPNPQDRYQSAALMRVDLLRAAAGQQVRPSSVMAAQQRTAHRVGGSARRTANRSAPLLASPLLFTEGTEPEDAEQEDELPQELQHGRHRGWAMAGLGALCAAVIVAVWLTWTVISAAPVGALVVVPDLSGMTVSEASALLQDSQLALGPVTSVQSAITDAGKVVGQRPSERTEVAQNSVVTLRIGAT